MRWETPKAEPTSRSRTDQSPAARVQAREPDLINEHTCPTARERGTAAKPPCTAAATTSTPSGSGPSGVCQGCTLWTDQGPAQKCPHRLDFMVPAMLLLWGAE